MHYSMHGTKEHACALGHYFELIQLFYCHAWLCTKGNIQTFFDVSDVSDVIVAHIDF